MNQTQSKENAVNLPPRMKKALEQYRKRVWIIKIAEGTLAAIFGLIISYLIVFSLDRLFDTATFLRALILLVGMVGMVIFLPLKYYNWVWRNRTLDGIARLLQHKFPRFGDHVLGIVELASERSDQSSSPALVAAAMRQVDEEVAKHNLADAVPNPRHRRWALAVGLPLVLVIIGVLVIPATTRNTLARWLTPWRDVERYTFAQLEGKTDRRVVAYAEPFDVEARLKDESPWKPESGEARYADQTPIVAEREGETYKFELPPQTEEGKVNLKVGDARRSIPVEPKLRPALKELIAKVQLPDYLQHQEPRIDDVRGGIVNLVKGSTATLEATTTRELSEATLNNRPQKVEGARVITEPISVETTTEMQLTWRDRFGLAVSEPQVLQFEAQDDTVPTVAITKLKNNQVVLSTEVLTFEIQAGDDFGVKRIGLEWEGIKNPIQNPNPAIGEKTVSSGSPTSEALTVPATFSVERENIKPQSLRLRAFAEDYFPNRERVQSPQIVLHVLTPAEHFKWLIGQMQLWAGAAKDVHDKELQLHQTNLELQDLSPMELDDPAQRKKLQNQASAERANAAKLDSLIQSGTELLQEAAKNSEFDGGQLESWAEMLKQLEEIAGKKMPSVANLLAQASEAPGQSSNQQPTAGSQQDAPPSTTDSQRSTPNNQSNSKPGKSESDVERYGPDSKNIPNTADEETPDDPNKSGDSVGADRSKPAEGKPSFTPANPTPSVSDVESGFNKADKPPEGQPSQIVGGLGIPTTILKGSGRNDQAQDQDIETPQASELVLEAVEEQKELLDAFAKLSDEMKKLLVGFENSTFVKRLKAASRKQIDIAIDLNDLDSFGLPNREAFNQRELKRLATFEETEAKNVTTIIQDMAAYTDRRPNANYLRVLAEMEDASVSSQMRDIVRSISRNFVGQSSIDAEFWADTLDRWAEQLVDPLPEMPPGQGGMMELPNLPPEIIVKVLRIINREIQLREETREVEQAKNALTADKYYERSEALSDTQYEIAEDTHEVAREISLLPNANTALIRQQLMKVSKAAEVMDEAESILATPDTGPKAIAAISEVIEILLETQRMPNVPGGGGGGNAPGGGGQALAAIVSALRLMGIGDDSGEAFIEKRSPKQATGKAGRVLPEEFRQGLDAYFNAIEGQ
ncbi:hypothetical protein J4G08_03995 [Candidatus Poribacteria bacterium]|nr:hypothetical protein [Candidatus Poribacteria bacterium]